MSKFRRLSLTLAIAAAASGAQAQEVVRLGNLKFAHYGAVSYIKEIAPKCGIKVEEHVFAKGPDVMQAILAGELDVGATASEAAISGRATSATAPEPPCISTGAIIPAFLTPFPRTRPATSICA